MTDACTAEHAFEIALPDLLEVQPPRTGLSVKHGRSVVEDEARCGIAACGVANGRVLERVVAALGGEGNRRQRKRFVEDADAIVVFIAIELRNGGLEHGRLKTIG